MAERRPPGFNVDLGFYDSAEVLSIPRKIRAAAIGVWTLCGAYSANKLTDGYVSAEALRDRGCTPAIRAALMSTTPEPLWREAHAGGIQFTRWAKWQRTSTEVKAYREADAERKRKARESKKGGSTSTNSEMSERTSGGQSHSVHPDDGDPKTETETKTETDSGYVTEESSLNVGDLERGLTHPVIPSASRLVSALIPDTIPAAVRTGLRLQASQLMNGDQADADVVAEALRRWLTKSNAGVGLLPHLAAEVIRERSAPATVHQLSAFERKKAANANIFAALAESHQPELES